MHYFAVDGSFGSADGIIVVDTSDFTGADWDEVEDASDAERVDVVKRIVAAKSGNPDQLVLF